MHVTPTAAIAAKAALAPFLAEWPMQAFITLNFYYPVKDEQEAYRAVQSAFIRQLSKRYSTQVAAIGIFNRKGKHHIHLLCFGNKHDLSLLTTKEVDRIWSKGTADVRAVCSEGAFEYARNNITPSDDDMSAPVFFNTKLLNKIRSNP